MYCLFVNVYCTTATGCQPNCISIYHIIYHIVLKSGSLNLLEPSGPVHACIGIAVPFTFRSGLYMPVLSANSTGTVRITKH